VRTGIPATAGSDSVFVIGFPKSGTTWLTRLVCDGLRARRASGMPGDEDQVKRTNAMLGLQSGDGTVVRKTHLLPGDLAAYLGEEAEWGLYVYRDLRDVLVSGFLFTHPDEHEDLLARGNGFALREALTTPWSSLKRSYWRWASRRAFGDFVGRVCREGWRPYGAWSEHIRQWQAHAAADARRRIVFVSYEDLRRDTLGELTRALEALDLEGAGHDELAAVVERHSAERMKQRLQSPGAGAGEDDPYRWVSAGTLRKAVVGDFRNYMTRGDGQRVERTHGQMLRELGYVDSTDWIDEL
jgi:hypothetical protein